MPAAMRHRRGAMRSKNVLRAAQRKPPARGNARRPQAPTRAHSNRGRPSGSMVTFSAHGAVGSPCAQRGIGLAERGKRAYIHATLDKARMLGHKRRFIAAGIQKRPAALGQRIEQLRFRERDVVTRFSDIPNGMCPRWTRHPSSASPWRRGARFGPGDPCPSQRRASGSTRAP